MVKERATKERASRQINKVYYRHEVVCIRIEVSRHSLRPAVLRDGRLSQCVRSHIDLSQSPIYPRFIHAPFFFKITCISRVINIDTKRMFIQGNLARESFLYVNVVTADLNETVCYQLRLLSETYCVYIKIKKALIC